MNKTNNNSFFKNTLLILISGFLIKLLGLLNKIIMTRKLLPDQIRLYTLSFPTIMLFISISSLSLFLTNTALISKALVTKKHSPKKILNESIKISLVFSLFIDIIFIIILKPLTSFFLKDEMLFYPLLSGLILIPLVGVSDSLKGYFNALKETRIVCISNLFEQIARIITSLIVIYFFKSLNIKAISFLLLLALSIGEIASIAYTLIKIKKHHLIEIENTSGERKEIIRFSIPNTLTRILGNFSYFLEPIIYTTILSKQGFDINTIHTEYTIIDAFSIPLLTFGAFLPFAISSSLVPHSSNAHAKNDMNAIHYYIKKSLIFTFIPCFVLAINFMFYSKEYMMLIYKTKKGTTWVKSFSIIYLCYYLHIPIVSILQTTGFSKFIFKTSTIFNFSRLLLIVILSNILNNPLNSIIISTTISMVISFLVHTIYCFYKTRFKFNYNNLLKITLISIITFGITVLLKNLSVNYLLVFLISLIIAISLGIYSKLIIINSLKKLAKN